MALPGHAGHARGDRHRRRSRCCWSSCGRSIRGSSSVRPRRVATSSSTCSSGRRSACWSPRRSSSSRAACSTSSSGIRGSSASDVRTRPSPGSRSAHSSCTSRSSCRSSARAWAPRSRTSRRSTSEGPSRRAVLRGVTVASGLALVLTVGQTVPFLRRISVFGVRDGDGPQDLPINRTARAAGATEAASDPGVRPRARGRRAQSCRSPVTSSPALPQRTHRLPIACVEGWSRNAVWTGVAVQRPRRARRGAVRVDGHRPVDADPRRVPYVGAAGRLRGRPANAAGAGAQRRAPEPRPRLPMPDHRAQPPGRAPDEMGPASWRSRHEDSCERCCCSPASASASGACGSCATSPPSSSSRWAPGSPAA